MRFFSGTALLLGLITSPPLFGREFTEIVRPLDRPIALTPNGQGQYYLDALRAIKRGHFEAISANICGKLLSGSEWHWFDYAEVEGLPGVFLFITHYQHTMNEAFVRLAGLKGEVQGLPKGILAPSRYGLATEVSPAESDALMRMNAARIENEERASGQNIPGADFVLLQRELTQRMASAPSWYRPDWAEGALLHTVQNDPRFLKYGDRFYVIAMSVQNSITSSAPVALGTLSHEIYHALYYTQPAYYATVQHFFHQVITNEEREFVRTTLRKWYGDNEEVIIDEFQAYLLEPGAENSYLGPLVPTRKAQLISALQAAGVTLPVVK